MQHMCGGQRSFHHEGLGVELRLSGMVNQPLYPPESSHQPLHTSFCRLCITFHSHEKCTQFPFLQSFPPDIWDSEPSEELEVAID